MMNELYKGDFCCISMEDAVRDDRWMVDYDHEGKSHFMMQVWPYNANKFIFFFCPWCGKGLKPEWVKAAAAGEDAPYAIFVKRDLSIEGFDDDGFHKGRIDPFTRKYCTAPIPGRMIVTKPSDSSE